MSFIITVRDLIHAPDKTFDISRYMDELLFVGLSYGDEVVSLL